MFQNLRRSMAQSATLKIECESCAHRTEWGQAEAFDKLGPDASPYEIRRRLRCNKCGDRQHVRVWI
jgi:ribosomal protein S27E